jgi:dipeptidyl aminopeptidase/acylaminoacyl peptidase
LISTYGTFLPPRRVHPEDGLSINTMAGWAESGQPRLGGAPWMAPQTYVANSPIFAAGRINTPMLLLQGDQDIASLTQAEEMFSALYRQNKDAILVSYWGEGHVVASPANLRDLYARVFQWLDDTLDQPAKPEPPG